jgi:zinc/manganese transport system permease protein
MGLEFQILFPAFLACLILTGIHAYLGMHVLAREVIFVDIALAQIASLGTAIASYRGIEPHTFPAYVWSLGFAFIGAGIFALTRGLRRRIPQEAFIGLTYAVAAAMVVLVANFLPHGDEELKELLVGNLLGVSMNHIAVMVGLYGLVCAFHWVFRKQFLELSFDHDGPESNTGRAMFWDLLFYLSFGLVITSSVEVAGVLVVFSFLIVPAVFSALFARRLGPRLAIAWVLGVVVTVVGLLTSFRLDLPTGATVVVTFGVALLLGAGARGLLTRMGTRRRA